MLVPCRSEKLVTVAIDSGLIPTRIPPALLIWFWSAANQGNTSRQTSHWVSQNTSTYTFVPLPFSSLIGSPLTHWVMLRAGAGIPNSATVPAADRQPLRTKIVENTVPNQRCTFIASFL